MRRALMSRPLLMCLLPLAVAACGGETIPPAPGPAHLSPTGTATAAAVPTLTATPTAVPTATPSPTATPVPSPSPSPTDTATPTPEPSPTPEPTPEPHGIEFTPITRVDPRPLPAGIALYYWVTSCTGCEGGLLDLRRVVFDEAAGALREDRPLAFFDGMSESFGVSGSGRTMAATICHAGLCYVEGVSGMYPTADAEPRLWVTRDGARTWEDWGRLLPETRIVEVTDDDVLVETENVWDKREHWNLTDQEWADMLARLAPLGLDELEGWEYRFRWIISGEEHSLQADWDVSPWWFTYVGWREGQPVWLPGWSPLSVRLFADVELLPAPSLAGLDWGWADVRPNGAIAWSAEAQGDHLLAITDEDGTVQEVYGAAEPLWGHFATDGVLIRPKSLPAPRDALIEIRGAEILDLATSSIHDIDGLSLPLGFDPETDGQQEVYYQFIAARPAPD